MSLYDRVVWKEGTFLVPQHFQQLDRFQESTVQFRLGHSDPTGWGVIEVRFDTAGIARGHIQLTLCKAILPNGQRVDIPAVDQIPLGRSVELLADQEALSIYLVQPARRPKTPLVTRDPQRTPAPFVEKSLAIPDDVDPSQTESIDVATANLSLILDEQKLGSSVFLKLAELHRSEDGQVRLKPNFVPHVIMLQSAKPITELGKSLVSMISTRITTEVVTRRKRGNALDLDVDDLTSFWFLQTLSRHHAALGHILEQPDTRPQHFFEAMLRLAGDLYPFTLKGEPAYPRYRADAMYESFSALDALIRQFMGLTFEDRYLVIPFTKKGAFWTASISELEVRSKATFVLEVTGDLPTDDLMMRLPNAFKLSESSGIERLVRTAVGGIQIKPRPRAPTSIPVNSDACYFEIDKSSQGWAAVVKTGEISGYIPGFLGNIKVQLIAIHGGDQ